MSSRRLTTFDFDDTIDLIKSIFSLGNAGCGETCGFTCAEITASYRVINPDSDLTDNEICNLLNAGRRSGVFNSVCSASVSHSELRDLAHAATMTSLSNNTSSPCGILCNDHPDQSVNGIINDPVNTDFSIDTKTLSDNGITVEPLFRVNQNMANINPENKVYVDHLNTEAQNGVRARRIAAGLPAIPPRNCDILCGDNSLQSVNGIVGGVLGGAAICTGVFTTS